MLVPNKEKGLHEFASRQSKPPTVKKISHATLHNLITVKPNLLVKADSGVTKAKNISVK